jgi:hypothetical protein
MPTLDTDAARREARRELCKNRRRGDFLTCDGGSVVMMIGGKRMVMTPPPSEAERKAEADRVWKLSCGPW